MNNSATFWAPAAELSPPTRICLDSCHLFAAGYDIRRRDGFAEMVESLQSCLGLNKVAWIHLNDSKRELGSRVDRHQHIGQGRIGLEGFRFFMNEPRFHHLPKILETPQAEGSGRRPREFACAPVTDSSGAARSQPTEALDVL